MIKNKTLYSFFKNSTFCKFVVREFTEYIIKKNEKQKFYNDAKVSIDKDSSLTSEQKKSVFTKWEKDYKRYNVTFMEFKEYGFENMPEEHKKEFISISSMQKLYRKYLGEEQRSIFFQKEVFLKEFSNFIHRKWMVITENSDLHRVQEILDKGSIIKPLNGTRGKGIESIPKGALADASFLEKYKGFLLEEKITGHKSIQAFHPNSLNTIRVVTFSNKGNFVIFGAFLRTGNNGNVVDNAHAGGIYAQINIETGKIESDGINSDGQRFLVHPISKIPFKNFQIPYWQNVIEICSRACKSHPEIRSAGWDVVVNDVGVCEFIEGNHAPDFDVMQAPLKKGVKDKVLATILKLKIDNN